MTLSDQEVAVLMLCNEGQSIMAIGPWEKPCEHLVAQGFLQRHDQFNHSITPKGRQALKAHEERVDLGLTTAIDAISKAKLEADVAIAECVRQLVIAARTTNKATGESLGDAAQRWLQVVYERTLRELSQ